MYITESAQSIATTELYSHLEQQVAASTPDIPALVTKRIEVERIGLTNNAARTPYLVYWVGDCRCSTFFKRRIFFEIMQLLLKIEYSIHEKIRSISVDAFNCFSMLVGERYQQILNRQVGRFVERCNNKAQPKEIKANPALAEYSMYAKDKKAAARNERIAQRYKSEQRRNGFAPTSRLEQQQREKPVIPTNEQLLEIAKSSGAIADFREDEEGGLYWIWRTPESKRELVTSCGLGMYLRKLTV